MVYQPGLGVEAAQRSRGGDRKQTLAKDGAAGAMDATFVLSFEVKCMFQYSSIRNGKGDSLHEVCARRRAGLTHPRGTCTISLIRICTGAIVCKMPK